jgi:two-component system, OmpR family, response regulator QseB
MRLLLVEDDTMIGEAVRTGLRQDGFTIDWVRDAEAGDAALKVEDYALLLLDLGLPRKSGLDWLRELRRQGQRIPVLILTARDAVTDRIAGLDGGADDYLVKPFDLDELAARVRAVLRRHGGRAEPLLRHGDLALDPAARVVTVKGEPISLSAREFALLSALLERPGAILSRAQLEQRLYGWGEEVESNAVEVHIHHLRRKLGADSIRNVRGLGYTLSKAPD